MINFSDIALDNGYLIGDKLKISQVLEKEIVVLDYAIGKSKYNGNLTTIQFYFADDTAQKKYVVLTGSTVLESQLTQLGQKYKDRPLEIKTTIHQDDKCYRFI